MERAKLRQTLKAIVELSDQRFDHYRLPLRVPVEGIGKFHILHHEVVLYTNNGAVKTIDSHNIEKRSLELAHI